MAYVLVLLALVCMTVKGYCGKKISGYADSKKAVLLFNLVRMLFCVLLGLLVLLADAPVSWTVSGGMSAICLLAGFSNVVLLVAWLLAIQRAPMATVDVILTIGSMLPSALCALFFGEMISGRKLFGYVLLLAATVFLAGYKGGTLKKTDPSGIAFAFLAAAGDGMISFSQQLYKRYYSYGSPFAREDFYPVSVYQFYTYAAAAVLFLLLFLIYDRGQPIRKPLSSHLAKSFPYIGVMAVCLFAASYLQTLATGKYRMPAQILYPMIRGGSLIAITGTGMIFFGERLTVRSILGVLIACAGIVVISL